METIWKVFSCFVALLFLELCNGLPLDLEHSYADGHTQFLTGLIAVLLTICGVICLAGCLCCQRRNGFKEFHDSPVVVSVSSNLDDGHVNPIANGEFTIFTPLSPPHQNNNVFLANSQYTARAEDYKNGDIDVSPWFGENERDFPRTKLKYIRELKQGWFGRIVEGTAQGLVEDENTRTPVIVRILEASASSRQRVLFLHDAAIYRCPPHKNLLQLLGRCLESVPLLLLQEYCTKGDLKLYLKEQQLSKETFLSGDYPLMWCCELASAIKHLHSFSIIHPDLAARNCQLTEDLHLKLGDYGSSTLDYPEDYYHGTENIPVRWCAPECVTYTPTTIQTKKFTAASNVWSLGVCLWEIYDCGSQPYGDLNDDEVISQVLGPSNIRLRRPNYSALYTDYIYRLMQLCWASYESRPTISQIEFMLADLLQVHENTKQCATPSISINDFDIRWDNFKPNAIVKTDHIDNNLMATSSLKNTDRLSASTENLAGSFDNSSKGEMDSWLENVDDLSLAKGLSAAMHDLDDAIGFSSLEDGPKLLFKLGPVSDVAKISSGSETEDENWKHKIERGAYTEKVRQKSRSVADLMILTHIDCSESDSETPLPSLDYRASFKNRFAPKPNLENVSLAFTSEGNLLNVQDTFQEELKKLQEERRDSLLFVPENESQPNLPSKKVLEELNSTILEPQSQVFNVYNVVTYSPKYSPIHLDKIINYKNDDFAKLPDVVLNTIETKREIPKLSEIIENNIELMDYIISTYENEDDIVECVNSNVTTENNSEPGNLTDGISVQFCTIKNETDISTFDAESRLDNIDNIGNAKLSENAVAKVDETLNCDIKNINGNLSDLECEELTKLQNNGIDESEDIFGFDINPKLSTKINGHIGFVNQGVIKNYCDNGVEESKSNKLNTPILEIALQNDINKKCAKEAEAIDNTLVTVETESTNTNEDSIKEEIDVLIYENEMNIEDCKLFLAPKLKDQDRLIEHNLDPDSNDSLEEKMNQKNEEESKITQKVLQNVETKLEDSSKDEYPEIIKTINHIDEIVSTQNVEGISNQNTEEKEGEYTQKNISKIYENGIGIEDQKQLIEHNLDPDSNDSLEEKINQKNEEDSKITQKVLQNVETKLEDSLKDEDPEIINTINHIDEIVNNQNVEGMSKENAEEKECEYTQKNNSEIEANKTEILKHPDITVTDFDKSIIAKTFDFINNEITTYSDSTPKKIAFDISAEQDEISPNSLTHSVFTSTPFSKRAPDHSLTFSSSDDYSIDYYSGERHKNSEPKQDLKYSLETWDNFLGKSFDEQHEFDTFTGQSLNFLEGHLPEESKKDLQISRVINETYVPVAKDEEIETTYIKNKTCNGTFVKDEEADNGTFIKDNIVDLNDINVEMDDPDDSLGFDNPGYRESESAGGWFLHPQSNDDELSGEINSSQDDSYVGFSMDDEIMAAIRNELLTKLPHAQRASSEQVEDGEEFETTNKNEVFVRYNCYNTPLSPIPEESYSELLHSGQSTPHCTINTDLCDSNSDWSEPGMEPNSLIDDDTHSPRLLESPHKIPQHRHTPSQDSCCSNDTLFNLEDFQYTDKHADIFDEKAIKLNDGTFTLENENGSFKDMTETETLIRANNDAEIIAKEDTNDGLLLSEGVACNIKKDDDFLVTQSEGNVCIRKRENELYENIVNTNNAVFEDVENVLDIDPKIEIVIQEECNDPVIPILPDESPVICNEVTSNVDNEMEESLPTIIESTIENIKTEHSENVTKIADGTEEVQIAQKFPVVEEAVIEPNLIIKIDDSNCSEFIEFERQAYCVHKEPEESSSSSETYLTVSDNLCYTMQNVAPLNSPEDRSWKHIEASLSKCPEILEEHEPDDTIQVIYGFVPEKGDSNEEHTLSSNSEEHCVEIFPTLEDEYTYENIEEMNLKNSLVSIKAEYTENENIYDCVEEIKEDKKKLDCINQSPVYTNELPTYTDKLYANEVPTYTNDIIKDIHEASYANDAPTYVNEMPVHPNEAVTYDVVANELPAYENMNADINEYANTMPDYVNTQNQENEYDNVCYSEYIDGEEYDNNDSRSCIEEVYGPLTDIRFTGPTDSQMITTSFSESNDLGDEQDWDSGSDTRSSSSGEFIWKEGEHEASVKALHAAPQDMQEDTKQGITEDDSSSSSEEDVDGPEFVPSAWDMYATPTKSALRSPEKTMDNLAKKGRGVSFKKQKYHCVYEYPREPESPVIQAFDLWKDSSNYAIVDWDLDRDPDPFLLGPSEVDSINDITTSTTPHHHSNRQHRNLYQITNVPEFIGSSILDEDFYISSSAKPFDMFGGPTSQFFPGKHSDWSELIKINDNITPDSGVEDITPGSLSDSSDYVKPSRQILPLKTLAQLALNKCANVKNTEIGGLRHTRNKLKLDLPQSPNAFTKTFTVEPIIDPIITRHVPTFTTFGKSRFVVQHVDTPTDDKLDNKNVSFEALPYKPITKHIYRDESFKHDKHPVESVRGEASLLDSADEDSGIESCILEKKNVTAE